MKKILLLIIVTAFFSCNKDDEPTLVQRPNVVLKHNDSTDVLLQVIRENDTLLNRSFNNEGARFYMGDIYTDDKITINTISTNDAIHVVLVKNGEDIKHVFSSTRNDTTTHTISKTFSF